MPTADVRHAPLDAAGPRPTVGVEAAGREWVAVVVTVDGAAESVRVTLPDGWQSAAYGVLEAQSDTRRPDWTRRTGRPGTLGSAPAGLLPLDADDAGGWRLGAGRRIWLDLRPPAGFTGEWQTAVEAVAADGTTLDALPLRVTARGVDLPDPLPLAILGEAAWDDVATTWPSAFAGLVPRVVSRDSSGSAAAVAVLDAMARLAAGAGAEVHLPDLRPGVTWPAGSPPAIDWADYAPLAGPWIGRSRFWPVPAAEGLADYPATSRAAYWSAAAEGFDERGWLDRSVIPLGSDADEPSMAELARLGGEAGRAAEATPLARLRLGAREDAVRFDDPGRRGLFPPTHAHRLVLAARPAVADAPDRPWPAGIEPPDSLVLDAPATGDAETRGLGWAAFLRDAAAVDVGDALDPQTPLFAPGPDGAVLPTVHLMRLRRAAQDHALLSLAPDAGLAAAIARAVVRPVERSPAAARDPADALFSGTADDAAYDRALGLLTAWKPHERAAWLAAQARPRPRVARVAWDVLDVRQYPADGRDLDADRYAGGRRRGQVERRIVLRAEVATHHHADPQPEGLALSWSGLPTAGQATAAQAWRAAGDDEVFVDPPPAGEVSRSTAVAWARASRLAIEPAAQRREALRVRVMDRYTNDAASAEVLAPAAVLEQRGSAPTLDGRLGEWASGEALLDGPMVRMADRATVADGRAAEGAASCRLAAGWTNEGLHLAFDFPAAADVAGAAGTGIEYEHGRPAGRAAAEVVLTPEYLDARRGDAEAGPTLYLALKPNGNLAAARRTNRRGDRTSLLDWQPVAADLRYAARASGGRWTGEVTVPWAALNAIRYDGSPPGLDALGRAPDLVHLNVARHDPATGFGETWAGPVDSLRDGGVTGLLVLERE